MPFSAGTVILEVWPSFHNVQRSIQRESRNIGKTYEDEVGKSLNRVEKNADDSAKRTAGAYSKTLKDRLGKALSAIDVKVEADTDPARRRLAALAVEAKAYLKDINAHVDLDSAGALAQLKTFAAEAEAIGRDSTVDIDVRTNALTARRELAEIGEDLARLSGLTRAEKAKRVADARAAADLERQQQQLSDALRRRTLQNAYRENADFNAKRVASERAAAAQIKATNDDLVRDYQNTAHRRLQTLNALRIAEREATQRAGSSGTDVDQTSAISAIRARYEAEEQYARDAERARVSAALRAAGSETLTAQRVQRAVEDSYDEQANAAGRAAAERIALARLAASVERRQARNDSNKGITLQQAWIGNIGQAANSFRLFNGALLTAVTLGPVLIPILAGIAGGLGGIAVAATAAIFGVGVLFAGLAGIGSAVSALSALDKEKRKQKIGSKSSVDTRGLRDAQLALARAREDSGRQIAAAARQQEQAERSLTKAVRDATDAQLDLINARRTAARDLEDQNNRLASGLLDEQLAAFSLQEAGARLHNVLDDPQATDREKKIAQLTYDQQVESLKELRTENRRLAEDTAAANAKGVEGSDAVVQAQQAIIDTTQGVADAQQAVADANADMTRARIEESRTLVDAEQRVSDAVVDLRKQSVQAGVEGSAAMDQLREAMGALSPAGQAFATFLYGLKPILDGIRDAAQTGLLPGLQTGIQTLVDTYGPDLTKAVGGIAQVLGDLFAAGAKVLAAPWWKDFFEQIGAVAPEMLRDLAYIFGALVTGFAGIVKAFIPYAPTIMSFIVRLADGFATWAKGLGGSDGFKSFMDFVAKIGPKVFDLLGNLLEILVNLGIGLAPYADKLLDVLLGFTEWLANMKPEDLAKLAGAILAIVAAIQALAGIFAIVSSLGGLALGIAAIVEAAPAIAGAIGAIAAPVAIVVGIIAAIAALVVGFKLLWDNNETFRTKVTAIWDGLVTFFTGVWNAIVGIFTFAWGIISGIFGAFVGFLETFVFPVILFLWNDIIYPVLHFIIDLFGIFWDVVSTVFNMIYQIIKFVIAPVFVWLYENIIKPFWEQNVQPIFDALGSYIEDTIAPAFQRGVDIIGGIWAKIIDFAKKPVEFVVNTVINKGIIDTFNKLVDFFPGMTKIDYVQLPQSWNSDPMRDNRAPGFKEGGVLPGYTPGRDVHRFVSPTGGMIDLSGGEGILVPQLTRALGRGWIEGANSAARNGGDLSPFLGGFADGGILGWLGNGFKTVTDAISGTVGNISKVLQDPASALKGLIDALLPDGSTGLAGIGRGLSFKVIDGISALLGGGAPKGAGAGISGGSGMGWQAMEAVLRASWPGVDFSSAYRPGAITAVGTPSYHGFGRAVDVVPPSMALFSWLSTMFPNSAELLYSPAGASQILRPGLRGNTSGVTKAMHYNHVHWAMSQGGIVPDLYDNGGMLPPGLSMVANRTGKPEPVFTNEQFERMERGGTTNIFDIEHMGPDARDVAEELDRLRRDRLTALGLSDIEVMI